MRKLIMNRAYFPGVFYSAGLVAPAGMTVEEYAERQMVAALHDYNPKLAIEAVEYLDIGGIFPDVKVGRSTALIVEEEGITTDRMAEFVEKGYAVQMGTVGLVARRIVWYVFVSPADEAARNPFVSQTIFPALLDYVEDNLDSPSYTPANHPFCFLNILNKYITSNMIRRHIAGLTRLGIHYVEVFEHSFQIADVPDTMREYLEKYDADFPGRYNAATDVFDGIYFRVDFREKRFVVKTAELEGKIEVTAGGNSFQGSSEKFYWIEMYPIAVWAYDLGYQVDYSQYEDFCNRYRGTFPARSDKFKRCETLLDYFQKYMI